MRFGQIKNLLRSSGSRQLLQHLGTVFVFFNAGHQLTVGKSSGTTFPELNIGIRFQLPRPPKQADVFLPFVNRFAPFNNNRLQTGFGQSKPGKHSCRPTADHQRTNISRLLFPNHQNRLFLYQFNIFPGQNRRNIIFVTPDFHIQGIYEMHIPLIAGINRFLGNFNTLDIFGIQPGFD